MSGITDPRLVKVYKSSRRVDMFLYVDFQQELTRVPEELMTRFGTPELALSLTLSADRKLARADAVEVLSHIESIGYYLQMPPSDGGVDAEIERGRRDQEDR
jgi:uncharacterized protein YcgL (UPF0745 family)